MKYIKAMIAVSQAELASCFAKYQQFLLEEGKVDFANQFYLALELLRKRPTVLKRYRDMFKYILVDEFQDTNFAQFQTNLQGLAGNADAQSILARLEKTNLG